MATIAQQNVALFLKNLRADPLTALKPPQSAVNSVAQWFKERSQPKKIIIKRKKKKTSTRLKKMTAGMSFLMTSGLMDRVRGFRMGTSTTQITPKMFKNYFKKTENKENVLNTVYTEVIHPAESGWNEVDYYGDLKVKARGAIYGLATFGKLYRMPLNHFRTVEDEFEIEDWQTLRATHGSVKKCGVALRKDLIKYAGVGLYDCERSYGEGLDSGIYRTIQQYVEENCEHYQEGLVCKTGWTGC